MPDRAWWEQLFSAIDSGDAVGFVTFLTADAQFRFGNAPAMIGSEAIRAAATGFFAAIASSRHHLLQMWGMGRSVGCEEN